MPRTVSDELHITPTAMFDTLSDKLTQTLHHLTGRGQLTENNMRETLHTIRTALLDADVSLSVVESFIETIRDKAVGQAIQHSLRPGEFLTKLVYDALVHVMGSQCSELNLKTQPPAVVLVAGLQGCGKTTTVGKLGYRLRERASKSVMVVSTDIYRPAAIEQLETVAEQAGIMYFPSSPDQSPLAIAQAALKQAKRQFVDVLIIDTAGRLHIDDTMMQEVQALHKTTQPIETLFVVDSMTGQDATQVAKAFHEALPLTGVILTKTDGDARGGAALSIRQMTGKPIKFLGVGEKIDALEPFHPDRIASRILGMGDIVSLAEEAAHKVDQKKAQKLAKKLRKGKAFDFRDFLSQLQEIRKLGGVSKLVTQLPGIAKLPPAIKAAINDSMFTKMEAMIYSMTPKERRFPALIKGSRKRRIATGSGTSVQDVNRMLKQFTRMQKVIKHLGGRKLKTLMQKMM